MTVIADVDGSLGSSELGWLYETVMRLPEGSVVLELGGSSGRSTCGMALGCWMTDKSIFVLWNKAAADPGSEIAHAYARWHQDVIRKDLVPYVMPFIPGSPIAPGDAHRVGMVFVDLAAAPETLGADLACMLDELRRGCIVATAANTNRSQPGWLTRLNDRLIRHGKTGSISHGVID